MTPRQVALANSLKAKIGKYALNEYQLEFAAKIPKNGPQSGKIYLRAGKDGLEYEVKDENGDTQKANIAWNDLPGVPKDISEIVGKSSKYLSQILKITHAKQHTYIETPEQAHERVRKLLGLKTYKLDAASIPANGSETGKIYLEAANEKCIGYRLLNNETGEIENALIPWNRIPGVPRDINTIMSNPSAYLAEITAYVDRSNPLYKGIHQNNDESTKFREAFIDKLVEILDDASKNFRPLEEGDTRLNDPERNTITLKELLGEDGFKLFKRAMREEAGSVNCRDAVLLYSQAHFEGKKWTKRLVAPVIGASGVGKTFSSELAIKDLEEQGVIETDPNDIEEQGNDATFVDGGNEREVFQMRQLVLQLALKKGYTYISDLNDYTHYKIKDQIEKAAEKSQLNIINPVTLTDLSKIDDLLQAHLKLENDPKTVVAVIDVSSNRYATAHQGTSRAANDNFDQSYLDDMSIEMNNRHIGCESKQYEGWFYDLGVYGSERFLEKFLEQSRDKICVAVGNDRALYKLVDNAGKPDWKQYHQNDPVYLATLNENDDLDPHTMEQAEKNNIPIYFRRLIDGKTQYGIYGYRDQKWQITMLQNISPKEEAALSKLDWTKAIEPLSQDKHMDNLSDKPAGWKKIRGYQLIRLLPEGIYGNVPAMQEDLSSAIINTLKRGHAPKIAILSTRDYDEWMAYKKNGFTDALHRIPRGRDSPEEWLAAYKKMVGLSLPLVDISAANKKFTPKISVSRSGSENIIQTPLATFDGNTIEQLKSENKPLFGSPLGLTALPGDELNHWAGSLLAQHDVLGMNIDWDPDYQPINPGDAQHDPNKELPELAIYIKNLSSIANTAIPANKEMFFASVFKNFYGMATTIAFTHNGKIQPWLIEALGKASKDENEIAWLKGQSLLNDEAGKRNLLEIFPQIANTISQFLLKTLISKLDASYEQMKENIEKRKVPALIPEKDKERLLIRELKAKLDNNYLNFKRAISESIKNQNKKNMTFYKKVLEFEQIKHGRLPPRVTDDKVSAYSQVCLQAMMNQLVVNPYADVSDYINITNNIINAITSFKQDMKIDKETITEQAPASRHPSHLSLFSRPGLINAGLATSDTSIKNVTVETKQVSFKDGDKQCIAKIEQKTLPRRAATSDITELNSSLDTVKMLAREAFAFSHKTKPMGLFSSEAAANVFFSSAIKQLKKYGGISLEGLKNVLSEEVKRKGLSSEISSEQIGELSKTLYKNYTQMTEQVDPKGRRFPSDAFMRLAKHHFDAHLKCCADAGVKNPKITINTECFDPHYVQAMRGYYAVLKASDPEKYKDLEEPQYDNKEGWDIKPPDDDTKKAFVEFFSRRYAGLPEVTHKTAPVAVAVVPLRPVPSSSSSSSRPSL